MHDSRNLIMAVVLSVAILIGFQLYTAYRYPPPPPGEAGAPGAEGITAPTPPGGAPTAGAPTAGAPAPGRPAAAPTPAVPGIEVPAVPGAARLAAAADRAQALATSPRVRIDSPRLSGSIALTGGLVDDLTLTDFRETLDRESPQIVFLSPRAGADAYYAQFGWVAAEGVAVPGNETRWSADRAVLGPDSPVSLTWDNGQGLRFVRTYALDANYMFTISQRVENRSASAVTLHAYGLLVRHGTPEVTRFFILHEGLLAVLDGTLKEVDYDDLQEAGEIKVPTTGGWIGITDKYWLTALVPDQGETVQTRMVHHQVDGADRYQADFIAPPRLIEANGSAETVTRFFAGAKEVKLLDRYEAGLGISRFDLAIDFGWFYFLTKPIFYTLIYINDIVGNFGVSILLLTVIIKLLFFPLANKSYRAMSKMKKLQPEMLKLREQFGDDKMRLNQEMMALYKREKANPASGCLPMIVQIPVFFALYKVLFVTIEMRQAPFWGWIHDLSAPDPTSVFNLFGLLPWDPNLYLPTYVNLGVWPLIMGFTMFLQQRLNPQPTDPIQAKVFMFLPIMFTFMLAQFPAGLVVYWAWNNTLSIIQQKVIMMRMGVV